MSKNVLASTEFFAEDGSGSIQTIELKLYIPAREDQDTVVCEYKFQIDREEPTTKRAYGATSWQALTLALSKLQLELKMQLSSASLFRDLTDAQNESNELGLSDLFGGLKTQF